MRLLVLFCVIATSALAAKDAGQPAPPVVTYIDPSTVAIRSFTLTFALDGGVQAAGCGRALVRSTDGGSYLIDLPACVSYALSVQQLSNSQNAWAACVSLLTAANGL